MTISAVRTLAIADDEWALAAATPHLSTDYLNRYGEALMLLEIAPMDPGVVDDLAVWRAVGYREHFQTSQLRCADAALAAYDNLAGDRRQAFEELCGAMNRLIATVTALLTEKPDDPEAAAVIDVACEALRTLMGRATQFINANGSVDVDAFEGVGLQDEIDALFAS